MWSYETWRLPQDHWPTGWSRVPHRLTHACSRQYQRDVEPFSARKIPFTAEKTGVCAENIVRITARVSDWKR
jgi:hypothetical protein